jgi:hypothetical protein
MGIDRWFSKSQRAQRLFQKGAGIAGKIFSKVHDVGSQVLSEVNKYAPEIAASPIYGAASLAIAGAGIAGKAATGLSQAKTIQDAGKSLGDAYRDSRGLSIAPPPAPGAETHSTAGLQTAADSM